jgi:NAD(P)-dependent dehydrogenase (short-subunit alcohol dehydrogenase family)
MTKPPIRAELSGKICLVTGATSGIGRAAAEDLARLNAHVVLGARSAERGETVRREIIASTGNAQVEVLRVDLSDRRSIREAGRALRETHLALHVLVNNAGVWLQKRQESVEGVEMTWATNVLGYFLLTQELLPALRAADKARVVNVASQFAGELDLGDVEFRRRRYAGRTAYAQSKQADRMLTWALARRLVGTSVTANAMHPGFVSTELFGKAGGWFAPVASVYARLQARRPAEGADTVVWLAASPEAEGRSGLFWIDRQERRCRFRNPEQEDALFSLCAKMTTA